MTELIILIQDATTNSSSEAAGALGPGYWLWTSGHPAWQTYIFSTLVFSQLANVLAIRSGKFSFFDRAHSANWVLYSCLAGVLALQGIVLFLPQGRDLLKIAPLTPFVFGGSIAMSLSVFFILEGEKWLFRRSSRQKTCTASAP